MKPKIICTLGTTTDDNSVLERMVESGMSCARMNTAYATIEEYQIRLDMLRAAKGGKNIDVMMDIKGPQVRLAADRAYEIAKGDIIYAGFSDEPIHFSKKFYNDVEVGDRVLIENGTIITEVRGKRNDKLALRIIDPGEGSVTKQMGVNVPGKYLNVERHSKKDVEVIDFAVRNNIQYIAQSFVRDYEDVKKTQDLIDAAKKEYNSDLDMGIIAKIEDANGVANIQDIITKSKEDGIRLSVMVARGDLWVELPYHEFAHAQEDITRICRENGVFVITATGVLESMQYTSRPTRAEINDVYNALAQGTHSLMLSGETSNGRDPVGVVETLSGLMNGILKRYG